MLAAQNPSLRRPPPPAGGGGVWSIVFGNAIGNSVVSSLQPDKLTVVPGRPITWDDNANAISENTRWNPDGTAANNNPVQVAEVMPTQKEIYGIDGTGETIESLGAAAQGHARSYRNVLIRSGDSLTRLAGTSNPATLDKIAEFNGLRSRHEIRAGEALTIPDAATLASIVPGQALAERGSAMAQMYAQRQAAAAQQSTALQQRGAEIATLRALDNQHVAASAGSVITGEITAVKPGLWERVWGAPAVQDALGHSILGQFFVKPAVGTAGTVSALVRDDNYDFSQLRSVHGVELQRAKENLVITAATSLVPALGAATREIGAVRAGAAANIREARNILREANVPLQARNEIIRTFELETFRVQRIGSEQTAYRVFDDFNARLEGRYVSTDFIADQTDRIQNFALMKNSATRLGEVTIPEGSVVFTGRVAPQPNFGPGLTGGANQMFLTGPLKNYQFREIMLPRQ